MLSLSTSAAHIPFLGKSVGNISIMGFSLLGMCSLVILLGSRELSSLHMTGIQRSDSDKSRMHSQVILQSLCPFLAFAKYISVCLFLRGPCPQTARTSHCSKEKQQSRGKMRWTFCSRYFLFLAARHCTIWPVFKNHGSLISGSLLPPSPLQNLVPLLAPWWVAHGHMT